MAVILVRSNIFNERARKRSSPPHPQKVCQCVKGKHLKCSDIWPFGHLDIWTTLHRVDMMSGGPKVSAMFTVMAISCAIPDPCCDSLENVPQSQLYWDITQCLQRGLCPAWCEVTSDNQLLLQHSSGQWSPWRGHWTLRGTMGQWYFLNTRSCHICTTTKAG